MRVPSTGGEVFVATEAWQPQEGRAVFGEGWMTSGTGGTGGAGGESRRRSGVLECRRNARGGQMLAAGR